MSTTNSQTYPTLSLLLNPGKPSKKKYSKFNKKAPTNAIIVHHLQLPKTGILNRNLAQAIKDTNQFTMNLSKAIQTENSTKIVDITKRIINMEDSISNMKTATTSFNH
eukprot:6303472-Ditylum_brightwellii.AAC.1